MLSKQETEKIKQGVEMIRQQVPDAELDEIIRMFNYVFGHRLDVESRKSAEALIVEEWKGGLT